MMVTVVEMLRRYGRVVELRVDILEARALSSWTISIEPGLTEVLLSMEESLGVMVKLTMVEPE